MLELRVRTTVACCNVIIPFLDLFS